MAVGLCLGIAAIGVTAGSAQAVLISANDSVSGVDSITQDTESGQEWLDLSLSRGLSINQARAQFGAEGWRLATTAEVTTLFTNAGFAPPFQASSAIDPILDLINLFGVTSRFVGGGGVFTQTRGFIEDGGDLTLFGVAELVHSDRTVFGEDLADAVVLPNSTPPRPRFHVSARDGSWLVRDTAATAVPEPSMLVLFGSGVVLLGAMRRRKQGV